MSIILAKFAADDKNFTEAIRLVCRELKKMQDQIDDLESEVDSLKSN